MSVDIIHDFVKYQIEWLTSHKDLEFEPVIADAIVQMLKDTGKSFIDEQPDETSQFDHIADSDRKVSISCAHENDLISRQAAIDAMKAMYRAAEKWLREAADDVTKARAESCMASLVEIKLRTEKLPAVQPDHNADIGKKVSISCDHENDVISRKMAIEALARMMPRSCTPDGSHPADEEIFKAQEIYVDCIESIEILPAVQPEIIHCKDCKHWRDDHTCHEHSLVSPMCANEYCSRAERRTDERFDRQTGGD